MHKCDIGKYKLITNGDFDPHDADAFLLDSLVLIDIRKFYFDGLNTASASNLHTLLNVMAPNESTHRRPDVIFGFALAETCCQQGGFDALLCRKMYRSAQTVVNWNQEEIDKAFNSKRPPAARDKQWNNQKVPIPSLSTLGLNDDADSRLFIMPIYGALLHLLKMSSGANSRNGIERFQEHCEWVRETLGCVSAYARVLSSALLLGNEAAKGKARSLLKVDHKDKSLGQKAWNAAWDAWFIQCLDGYRLGMLATPTQLQHQGIPSGAKITLVTANDQIWVDSITDFSVAFNQNEVSYPLICSTVEMRDQEASECLKKEIEKDALSCLDRINGIDLIGKMRNVINNLEDELCLPIHSFALDR